MVKGQGGKERCSFRTRTGTILVCMVDERGGKDYSAHMCRSKSSALRESRGGKNDVLMAHEAEVVAVPVLHDGRICTAVQCVR
jgi:hypothetical protein